MSFSAHLSNLLKNTLYEETNKNSPEFRALSPIFDQQKKESIIPKSNEFLIERFETREGFIQYSIHLRDMLFMK